MATIERKLVAENLKRALLKQYIMEKSEHAGYGGIDIQRTPLGTRVTIITQRAGLVIGKKGSYIREITDELTTGQWINALKGKRMQDYQYKTAGEMMQAFKIENPLLEVQEVDNPDLSAQISSQRLAEALERGWHFRRAGHSTAGRIMGAGAQGCQIIMSGKVTGARSRCEKITVGRIQYCGEPVEQWVETGYAVARPKLGTIGVTIKIMSPNAELPSDVKIPPVIGESREALEADKVPSESDKVVEPKIGEAKEVAPEKKDVKAEKSEEKNTAKKAEDKKEVKTKAVPEQKKADDVNEHKEEKQKDTESTNKEKPVENSAETKPQKQENQEKSQDKKYKKDAPAQETTKGANA
jgi:small subunit ribosomal protein S3